MGQGDVRLSHSRGQCVCGICSLTLRDPTNCVASQAPLCMGFFRQEHWSCHFLLQGLKPHLLCLLHCRRILYHHTTMEAFFRGRCQHMKTRQGKPFLHPLQPDPF